MARVDSLYQGSWNGVEFLFMDASWNPGLRGQLHEYPDRDQGYFERLGKRTQQLTLDVFVLGDDWIQQRRDLVEAFGSGEGTLVHPVDGRMSAICIDVRVQETVTELGRVGLTVTMLPGNTPLEASDSDTGSDVDSGGDDAADASDSDLDDNLDTEGQPPEVVDGTKSFLGGALDTIGQVAGVVGGAIAAAEGIAGAALGLVGGAVAWFNFAIDATGAVVRTVVNDVSALTGINVTVDQLRVSFTADLISTRTNISLVMVYGDLGPHLISLVKGISSLQATGSGQPFQGWDWQRRVGPARTIFTSGSATNASAGRTAATIGGYSAATVQAVLAQHLQLFTSMARPTPPRGQPDQATTNINAIADIIRRAALIEAAGAFSAMPFDSRDDAFAMRDRLAQAIDDEVNLAESGAVRKAFRALRLAVIADAKARSAGLPDTVQLQLGAEVPAVVLAARLYDDPGMAADLVARNKVDNPLFMPADAPLEVLSHG